MRNMGKRLYIYIIGVVCTVMAVVGLTGCTSSPDTKDYRIGVSQPSSDSWRETMNDEIHREQMFHPGVSVEILSADNSNEQQMADLRHFIDEGVDLILVSPNEPEPLVPLVEEAQQKGIPVISFDRRLKGDGCTMHIEVDNEALGREVAEYATALFPQGARILEVEGNIHTSAAAGRHKGFAEAIAQHPEMQLVASVDAGWDYGTSRRLSDSVFQQHPDIDLVFAHTDGMAINVAEVAKARGLTDIKFLGIDGIMNVGIQAVTDSVITATFLYPTYGYLLLRQAIDVLDGKPYERERLLPPVSAVDLRNADILRQQVQMQYEETDKLVKLRDKLNDFLSQYAMQQMLLYAAIIIVLAVVVIIIVLVRTLRHDRQHQRVLTEKNEQLELEKRKQEALYEQLADATQAKLMFFTNVSHDLRTPLTLIAEPIEQLCGADNLTEQQSQLMGLASKNVRILRRLIDQILDFRKYENGKEQLRLSEVSIYPLVQEWAQAFEVIARKRGMHYSIKQDLHGALSLAIDAEKMERVVFNIISNAFKYTPDGGNIEVELHHSFPVEGVEGDGLFMLSVTDTGHGISREDQDRIFDRFYQVEKATPNGSGIGLALTKAFVEMHGGVITVESELGKGTRFTVSIPIAHTEEVHQPKERTITEESVLAELDTINLFRTNRPTPAPSLVGRGVDSTSAEDCAEDPAEEVATSPLPPREGAGVGLQGDEPESGLPLLLVIDDNADILRLVKVLLGHEYEILTASNGQQGVQMALKHVPDVILCDVMMPVMDGLECCRIVKSGIATCHIPILMLTACSLDEQRIEGYDSGADGYMSKPFSAAVLKSRLRNLLDNRKRLDALHPVGYSPAQPPAKPVVANPADAVPAVPSQQKERTEQPVQETMLSATPVQSDDSKVSELPVGKMDNMFYSRVLDILNEEYRNPDLSIEQIASRVGLSQSQFCRKVKALTNYTPVELIKRIRVEMGQQLLTTTDKTIAEVAYEVGFSDPNYFSKCYKQIYGVSPTKQRGKLK